MINPIFKGLGSYCVVIVVVFIIVADAKMYYNGGGGGGGGGQIRLSVFKFVCRLRLIALDSIVGKCC